MISPALQEELTRVVYLKPEWRNQPLTIDPVPGGLTNENFRITVEGYKGTLFVKVPGVGTEKFIDRATAHAAATAAAKIGISPQVHLFDEKSGIEIAEFLTEYRAATTLDFQSMDVGGQVMDLYRKWHGTEKLPQTKTMIDMVEEHLEQVQGSEIELPYWAPEVLDNYRRAAAAFTASGLDLVSGHNDPMPGNFLMAEGKSMKLIDFDYAANNDASYDLGAILTEMFIGEEYARELVEEYADGPDSRLFARAQVSRMIADTKWGLWGLINSATKDDDFDYYKYGIWKLYRTFYIARNPSFEKWLTEI